MGFSHSRPKSPIYLHILGRVGIAPVYAHLAPEDLADAVRVLDRPLKWDGVLGYILFNNNTLVYFRFPSHPGLSRA